MGNAANARSVAGEAHCDKRYGGEKGTCAAAAHSLFHSIADLDARYFQIAVLSFLVCYGLFVLRFDVTAWQCALSLGTVLITQYLCSRAVRGHFEPRSALISGLSLCLLLRADSLLLVIAGGVLAILVKFLVRIQEKHIFNPTNFGIGILLLLSNGAWVSPGQWGSLVIFGAALSCLGFIVVKRAERSDVTLAFLGSYVGLLTIRAYRLGDPLTIPLHQLESGSLLLFAFFMISDPRTTPDARAGRILFAVLVSLVAYYLRFYRFNSNALIFSLLFVSCFTPLIDRMFPESRFQWTGRTLFLRRNVYGASELPLR